jgi:hypothetical protein
MNLPCTYEKVLVLVMVGITLSRKRKHFKHLAHKEPYCDHNLLEPDRG